MGDAGAFGDEVFGFHAQQVAEKCLKAWMSARSIRYPRTHNIRVLLEELAAAGEDVGTFWDLHALTGWAMDLRYDPLGPDHCPLERADLLRDIEAVFAKAQEVTESASGQASSPC
jgi:HEPN domain-containing protein